MRGILLSVHFSFFLLLGVYAFNGWADGGGTGALQYAAVLIACFICVVLHELGHCFTAMHYGIGVRRILLMPIGGMAEFDDVPRQPRRELLITLAGPAVNFLLATALWLILPPGALLADADTTGTLLTPVAFGQLLLHWNLAMGCFNLLPAFPMDGGRILRALLATRCNYLRATFWAASVGKFLCVICAVCAALFMPIDSAVLVVALFTFIFLVGELEYRAAKRRESDDAHLRATLARLYPLPVLAEEPPVLRP